MTDFLITYVEMATTYAPVWGFLIVFFFMTVESSFIPFPSEIVMIPAGFMAYRSELSFSSPFVDLTAVIIFGLLGSILGAYINYFLSLKLGKPFLEKYGKYFFLSPAVIARAEEIFLKYGDITTFVCRLLPGIRQLISIPAGVSKMPLPKFTLFTALGAGIWSAILAGIGFYLASLTKGKPSYSDLIHDGKDYLHANFIWIALALLILCTIYIFVHKIILKEKKQIKESV